ncbi:GyrI-like domain-containing protein [bacterium]|nr:GyrI-like domain-containing protein [bacterium]
MKLKTVEPQTVFFHATTTTIPGLMDLTLKIPPKLFLELEKTKSKTTGPISWHYYGMDGNPETEFQLEIAIPVDKSSEYQGEFGFKSLGEFKCVSLIHEGSWTTINKGYEKLIQETIKAGYALAFESREIYHNIKTAEDEKNKRFDALDNVTEIQMKLQ